MLLLDSSVCGLFKWRQFEPEVILMAVGMVFALLIPTISLPDDWRLQLGK